jgi:small subunit ribosomal protein S8e
MRKGRKITGGKYKKGRKKKSYEFLGQKVPVKIGILKRKSLRIRGGNKKTRLLKINYVNVKVGEKIKKLEVKNVLETPSNKFLARQNILTKGTIVDTPEGKVRITSRPGQEPVLNGILLKK